MVLFVEFCGYCFVTTQESGKEKGQRHRGTEKKGSKGQRHIGTEAQSGRQGAGIGVVEKDEHRTSNIEHRMFNGKR